MDNENKEDAINITLLEILQLDCVVKVTKYDFARLKFRDHELVINYEENVSDTQAPQMYIVFIPYSSLHRAKIEGHKVTFIDEDDQYLTVEIYLPVGSPKYSIQAVSDTITVSIVGNDGEVEARASYWNNEIGKKLAKSTFIGYMLENISNAGEYSNKDIEDAWGKGECELDTGKIMVTFDLTDPRNRELH